MPTHRVAWIGAYEPLKPWRFDTGYPSISLFMGDDVDIYFRATMRAATTIYTPDGGFESTVVDLTYAKIIFTLTPARPRPDRPPDDHEDERYRRRHCDR